jgi:hypothetical protein
MARDLSDFGIRILYYINDQEERLQTPEDRLFVAIRGYRGESERDRARLRTRDAHAARARQGWVTGGVVFGYTNVPVYSGTDSSGNPIRSHVEYKVDPAEAEVLHGMFRMRGGPIRVAGSWKHEPCYGCGYHNDRGSSVCSNNLLESVRVVDRRLLDHIEATVLVPEARRYTIGRAREIVAERLQTSSEDVGILRDRLVEVDREVQNLVRAIEEAKQHEMLQPLTDRIAEQQRNRHEIEAEIRSLEEMSDVTEVRPEADRAADRSSSRGPRRIAQERCGDRESSVTEGFTGPGGLPSG